VTIFNENFIKLTALEKEIIDNCGTGNMTIKKLASLSKITNHECRIGNLVRKLIDDKALRMHYTSANREIIKLAP